MPLRETCRMIENWDTLDIYALREMLIQAAGMADREGTRLDELIDITDLPTVYAREMDTIRSTVVWACDMKGQCLHGPDFDVTPLDELLEKG